MQCFQIVLVPSYTYSWYSKSLLSSIYQYDCLAPSVSTCSDACSSFLLTCTYIFECLLVPILSINDTTFSIFYIYFDGYFQYISDFLTPILSVLLTWYITCTGTLNVLYTYSYRCSRYTWYLSSTILLVNKKLTC